MKKKFSFRVCMVTPYFYPYPGGLENAVFFLSRCLVQRGYEIKVVTTSSNPYEPRSEVMEGIEVYRIQKLFAPLNNPISIGLPTLLQRTGAHIIHVHGYFNFSTDMAYLIAKITRTPIILSFQGYAWFVSSIKRGLQLIYDKTVGPCLLRGVNRVIASSKNDKSTLTKLGAPIEKVIVIPNGVDTDMFNPYTNATALRTRYCLNGSKVILFVGRLIARKGCHFLLNAMPKVLDVVPEAILIIIGDGPEAVKLKSLSNTLNLQKKVIFLSYVPNARMPEFYASSDVVVLPSISEGFPITLLEAMAMGKPIVATRIGGTTELVTGSQSGILVPLGDVDRLSEEISKVLTNSSLAYRLGENGRRVAVTKYSWDVIAKNVSEVYAEIIRENARQAAGAPKGSKSTFGSVFFL